MSITLPEQGPGNSSKLLGWLLRVTVPVGMAIGGIRNRAGIRNLRRLGQGIDGCFKFQQTRSHRSLHRSRLNLGAYPHQLRQGDAQSGLQIEELRMHGLIEIFPPPPLPEPMLVGMFRKGIVIV